MSNILFFDIETRPITERAAHWGKADVSKMALDVDFAGIAALGYALDAEPVQVLVAADDDAERELLREFYAKFQGCNRVCGYNILDYDLHIIQRRAFALGVKPTRHVNFRRYTTSDVVDLMQLFYNWGTTPGPRYRGLKAVCGIYGIDIPAGEMDGAQSLTLPLDDLAEYCKSDVEITRELARRMYGYYWW